MKSKNNPTTDFSSKIKRIYLELNEYSFFHGPSEIGHVDRRFIGRKEIIEKLKSLLTNNETKSGAYLVTGHRGMGKSSFVNKVLNEISSGQAKSKKASRYFRIFLILFLLPLINVFANSYTFVLFFALPLLLFFFQFVYLLKTDIKKDDLKLSYSAKKKQKYFMLFLRTFLLEKEAVSENRIRATISDLYLISVIQLSALIISQILDLSIELKYLLYFILFVLLIVFSSLFVKWDRPRLSAVGKNLKEKINSMWQVIRKYVNYSHRFYIRINLGHDKLTEIDILRLIARNVLTKYERVMRFGIPYSFPHFLWNFLKILILFLLLGVVYHFKPINNTIKAIKKESAFVQYFPSQGHFLLKHPKKVEKLFNDKDFSLRKYLKVYQEESGKNSNYFNFFNSTDDKNSSIKEITINEKELNITPFQRVTIYTDMIVYQLYIKFRKFLILPMANRFFPNDLYLYLGPRGALSRDYKFFPESPDYLFVFIFIILWFTANFIAKRFRLFGFVNHHYLMNKLYELNDIINAQVIKERGGKIETAKFNWSIGGFRRKIRNYPIADVREIEKELIDILESIDRIPRIMSRPQFVFIFDELDKIEPHKNVNISEKEDRGIYDLDDKDDELVSIEGVRKRQYAILSILSNLKHFLTTAKARFIFIAGREMYDAALADVSDRHYFIGSIFNEIIYVNSFLSDFSDKQLSDFNSMTETYVCQFLLPEEYFHLGASITTYNRYLKENFLNDEDDTLSEVDKEITRLKREKIIFTLQNFITYLTYRSNGAPKKLTRYFESFIKRIPVEDLLNTHENLTIGHNSNNLYLTFNYHDQYTIGLVTYLANPFLLSINKSVKDFGDKLLVSTSFLVDHIYKFHGFGFSWRNLEITPEIIDINKAPELRELIGKIIHLLTNVHIHEIVSGLYNFKFTKRMVEEISFLSKISEKEAAAFNFTLDESLSTKRHYKKKLRELETKYKGIYHNVSKEERQEYIHSIGFIHMVLGDLYFYDEEYDDAVLEYMEAVQMLRNLKIDGKNFRADLLLLFIRNMLKKGLTFERKKTYDSAYLTYGRLTSLIVGFKDLVLSKLADEYDITPPEFEDQAFNNSLFEGLRIIYQPFLAKLGVVEKGNLGGIKISDIKTIKEEFSYLIKALDEKHGHMLWATFFDKLGDFLFFKNCTMPEATPLLTASQVENKNEENNGTGQIKCQTRHPLCGDFSNIEKTIVNNGYKLPCTACCCYWEALEVLCRKYLGIGTKNENIIVDILESKFEATWDKIYPNKRMLILRLLATILSSIGNIFLCCATKDDRIGSVFLDMFMDFLEADGNIEKAKMLESFIKDKQQLNKLQNAFFFYYLSANYFRKAGDRREYSFQNLKILHLIRDYIGVSEKKDDFPPKIVEKIGETIVSRAIRSIYRTYDNIHRVEIEKFQEVFNTDDKPSFLNDNVNLNQISINSDIKETILIYSEIKLKTNNLKLVKNINFISPYSPINSMFNRLIELRFTASLNYMIFKELGFAGLNDYTGKIGLQKMLLGKQLETTKYFGKEVAPDLAMEHLIADSIFCYHEVIKGLDVFGVSYMSSHSFMAYAHKYMSKWCVLYYAYLKNCDDEARERIQESLGKLIGHFDKKTLAPNYHNEMALKHFYLAMDTHKEGKPYKRMIENMYYLNDDFNDTLFHFCAGMERYRINSDKIKREIEEVKKKVEESRVYDYKHYITKSKMKKLSDPVQ